MGKRLANMKERVRNKAEATWLGVGPCIYVGHRLRKCGHFMLYIDCYDATMLSDDNVK